MPVWVQILLGAVPGSIGLFMAIFNMGSMKRDVHDLLQRAQGWDEKITAVQKDTAYLRGLHDGRQDTLLEAAPAVVVTQHRRPKAVAAG